MFTDINTYMRAAVSPTSTQQEEGMWSVQITKLLASNILKIHVFSFSELIYDKETESKEEIMDNNTWLYKIGGL